MYFICTHTRLDKIRWLKRITGLSGEGQKAKKQNKMICHLLVSWKMVLRSQVPFIYWPPVQCAPQSTGSDFEIQILGVIQSGMLGQFWLHRRCQRITEISEILPLLTTNICSTCRRNPSDSCWDFKEADGQTDVAFHKVQSWWTYQWATSVHCVLIQFTTVWVTLTKSYSCSRKLLKLFLHLKYE